MFCPKCGKELRADAKFCPGCGNSLTGIRVEIKIPDVYEIPQKPAQERSH